MSRAIYNEVEPFAVQWMRNLIAAGHVASGVVDGRSIKELQPDDVAGPGQRHFFAGIAVWSLALRMAGYPDDAPVWTGSCPCQPFSSAGQRRGTADERHLWPEWFRLIRECGPAVVVGEQVASKDGLAWLDTVRADMEGAGYAFAAFDLCAAGVGAPHIRQRLYFAAVRLAHHHHHRREGLAPSRVGAEQPCGHNTDGRGTVGGLADAASARREGGTRSKGHGGGFVRGIASENGGLGDTGRAGLEGLNGPGHLELHGGEESVRPVGSAGAPDYMRVTWLDCRDGKRRPTEPGLFPLAHGASGRVGRLRAYGNAIVAPLAAEFLRALKPEVSHLWEARR